MLKFLQASVASLFAVFLASLMVMLCYYSPSRLKDLVVMVQIATATSYFSFFFLLVWGWTMHMLLSFFYLRSPFMYALVGFAPAFLFWPWANLADSMKSVLQASAFIGIPGIAAGMTFRLFYFTVIPYAERSCQHNDGKPNDDYQP